MISCVECLAQIETGTNIFYVEFDVSRSCDDATAQRYFPIRCAHDLLCTQIQTWTIWIPHKSVWDGVKERKNLHTHADGVIFQIQPNVTNSIKSANAIDPCIPQLYCE